MKPVPVESSDGAVFFSEGEAARAYMFSKSAIRSHVASGEPLFGVTFKLMSGEDADAANLPRIFTRYMHDAHSLPAKANRALFASGLKRCKTCGAVLPLERFYVQRSKAKSGICYNPSCMECCKAKRREAYAKSERHADATARPARPADDHPWKRQAKLMHEERWADASR